MSRDFARAGPVANRLRFDLAELRGLLDVESLRERLRQTVGLELLERQDKDFHAFTERGLGLDQFGDYIGLLDLVVVYRHTPLSLRSLFSPLAKRVKSGFYKSGCAVTSHTHPLSLSITLANCPIASGARKPPSRQPERSCGSTLRRRPSHVPSVITLPASQPLPVALQSSEIFEAQSSTT